MLPVLILDYPVLAFGVRMFVIDFFPESAILHAYDQEQAEAYLSENDIALVIMDIHVIDDDIKNDIRTIRRLRKIRENVRIMIFTEVDNEKYADDFLMAGVNGFLSKNSRRDESQQVIDLVMEGTNYCNRRPD